MSKHTAKYRTDLRHEILKNFDGVPSKDIYYKVKVEEAPYVTFEDLRVFSDSAKIPFDSIPDIFAAYGIFNKFISEEKFVRFLEDEVTNKTLEVVLPEGLASAQKNILVKFVDALTRRRTEYAVSSSSALSSGHSLIANMWVYAIKTNPPDCSDKFVRLASLCRLCDEFNVAQVEDFIDAIFAFYESKIDQLDFQQFARLIEAFT